MLLNNVNVSQKIITAKLTKDKRILLVFIQKKKTISHLSVAQ